MDTSFGVPGSTEERSRHEGRVTSEIEKRAANIPSITSLALAGAAVLGSVSLYVMERREMASFVGMWVPSLLILGLYNKLVKQNEMVKPISSGMARH